MTVQYISFCKRGGRPPTSSCIKEVLNNVWRKKKKGDEYAKRGGQGRSLDRSIDGLSLPIGRPFLR